MSYTIYTLQDGKKEAVIAEEESRINQVAESGSSSRCSTGSSSRHASLSTDPICIICGKFDKIDNLHAAGAFHATKSKLNVEHVTKLTNQWRNMAVYIGDDALKSRLMIGDLGANSSFYHKRCSTNLFNKYTKKCNDPGRKKID